MSDSFEKIAEDALMDEYSYCEERNIGFGEDADPAEYSMRRDLISRMKAVAARGCNEERLNMASSLRYDAAYGEGTPSEWWGRLQFIVLDGDDFQNPRQVFKRLADLIDPEGGSDED